MSVVKAVLALLLAVAGLTLVPTPAWAAGTVTVTVTGQGTVTGEGISCSGPGSTGDCSQFYDDFVEEDCDPERKPPCIEIRENPTVQLTASPGSNGYGFAGWSGCDSTSGSTCTVTVDASRGVGATYQDIQVPTVSPPHADGPVRGTITLASSAGDNSGQVSRVEFRVRGALVATDTVAPYSTSFDTTTVADGSAQVVATAYDAAGNSSGSVATVTIDNTAPETSVTDGPADGSSTNQTTLAFTLGANDAGATFGCRLYLAGTEAPAFDGCSSGAGHIVSGLDDGTYVFEARATDQVGNVDATPASRTFTVDTTAPETTIVKGPKAVVKTTKRRVRAPFEFGSDEPGATFTCKLDDGNWKDCTSPTSRRVAKGQHTFKVRATDLAGNRDGSPAKWSWKVRRR